MADTPIIESNIKGLRWRDLITIIGCTATIIISFMTGYLALKSDISTIKLHGVSDARIIELRISTLEAQLKAQQLQIETLRTDILINRKSLEIR